MMRLTAVIVLAALVALNGWLVAAATSIRSVSRIWLRHWAQQRDHGVPAASLYLARPDQLLMAGGLGLTTIAVLAGAVIGGETSGIADVIIGLAVFAAIILVAGQIVPRALGRRWAQRLVPVLLPSLQAMAVLTAPLLWLSRLTAGHVRRREATPDVVRDVFRDAQREGVSRSGDTTLVSSVVTFGVRLVRDVMTPRSEVFALDVATPPADAAGSIARAAYSRVPVYRGTFDDVVGMVHAFDVYKIRSGEPLPVRPVARASDGARLNDLMFEMLRDRRHLAIVADGAGRSVGIVTLEDLLEALVGDIEDEHDE